MVLFTHDIKIIKGAADKNYVVSVNKAFLYFAIRILNKLLLFQKVYLKVVIHWSVICLCMCVFECVCWEGVTVIESTALGNILK